MQVIQFTGLSKHFKDFYLGGWMFGAPCSQIILACNRRAVLLSTVGISKLVLLTWERSLGNIQFQILNGNSWIDIFASELEI